MSAGILCIGECMVELAPDAAAGDGMYRQGFAGDTFNTAVYLARLRAGPVDYMTAVGTDPLSDRLVARLRDEGVGTGPVRRFADRAPGLYLIETDAAGERRFQYWRGASAARAMLRGLDRAALAEVLAPYAAVYLSGITLAVLEDEGRWPLLDALADWRRRGGRRFVAFDSNYRAVLWPDPAAAATAFRRAAAVSDVVLGTWDDDAALFGDAAPEDAAARWRDWGAATVVVRTGATGSLVAGPDGTRTRVAAAAHGRVVDTTGGGDSFNAGFLALFLAGAPAAKAAAFGHRVAGQVVTCPGAIMDRDRWDAVYPTLAGEEAGP
ncbi:MAG: sugar kinase [Hyphomicrobiales bacterium]|nr:sugar kinase [Hyphomicrobiales bacterium]MCP5370280.1 sugar kinase [Hyphomicrobiales bacterium]